jgi:hypothetical protein
MSGPAEKSPHRHAHTGITSRRYGTASSNRVLLYSTRRATIMRLLRFVLHVSRTNA